RDWQRNQTGIDPYGGCRGGRRCRQRRCRGFRWTGGPSTPLGPSLSDAEGRFLRVLGEREIEPVLGSGGLEFDFGRHLRRQRRLCDSRFEIAAVLRRHERYG